MAPQEILNVPEAAAYLRVSPATLNRYRSKGGGPVYTQTVAGGRVCYRKADLDAWLKERSWSSTSEAQETRANLGAAA